MTVSRRVPRIVLAAASSGSGKTTLTVVLAAALRARGIPVAPFKCGPDYLDPSWHARAAGGRTSHNLDGWMMGREAVRATFARAARGGDVALVEGVMGLFDGASPRGEEGSTAEIAKWLDAPVVVVVDASGVARTLAAVLRGLAEFDPALRVAGAICNRVGGRRHLDLLREAVAPFPVLGGLPEDPALRFPERHLGLHTASASLLPDEALARAARTAEEWIDVDGLLEIARSAPPVPVESAPASPGPVRCRIGLALDEAFHFYYADNLARLEALGARLVPFSPIRDVGLPDVDALYLGGGYPEEHAAALAANASMRQAIRAFARSGRPVYAECGGLMYLSHAIRGRDGVEHEMVGLVPGVAVMRERLAALGYAEVETQAATVLGPPGVRFRGHQFRYSDLEGVPAEAPRAYLVRRRRGGDAEAEGYGGGSVLASYIHAHWASCPDAAAALVEAAARGGRA